MVDAGSPFYRKKGNSMKKIHPIIAALITAMLPVLFSCEFLSSSGDENNIDVLVLATGGTSSGSPENSFTVTYVVDNHPPFNQNVVGTGLDQASSILPAGNAKKITITAVKIENSSSLTILVYNHGNLDNDNGYANLPSCSTSSTTSCTNTLVLQYEVKSTNDTNTTGGTTTTSTSSSTSSSSTTSSS